MFLSELNGSYVARKVFDKVKVEDVSSLFFAELEKMMELRHPNIVLLLGYTENPLSLVIEYMEKGSLAEVIRSDEGFRKAELSDKLLMAQDIARGLAYIHTKMIHGDIKPHNILVNRGNQCKIADFGISKLKPKNKPSTGNTLTTMMGGSEIYLAPETIQLGKVSEKSDVYAFGLVLWEMIHLLQPFHEVADKTAYQFQHAIITGTRPVLSSKLPLALKDLINSAWETQHDKRPLMKEIIQKLNAVIEI